jgi:hypothetical protein
VLLGLFVMVDLARVGSHWINPYNWKQRYLETTDNAVFQLLRQKPYENRVAIWPFGLPGQFGIVQQLYQQEWLQHLFQYYNIQSLDIIQMPRVPQDIAAFESAMAHDSTNTIHRIVRRWELANMRYLIGPAGLYQTLNQELDAQQRFRPVTLFEFYQTQTGGPILTRTNSSGPFAIFEFTGALPRAKLYSQWQVITNDDATLTQLASKEFKPEQIVLVSEPLPSSTEGATNSTGGVVEFKSYAPKRILLQAKATSPSVLLLNDKHDPNWQVLVDGKPAPLLRCNFIMRGVFLEPGEHAVEFRFRPPMEAFYVSLAAIALGLPLVGFAIADGRRRPASQATPGSKPA